MKSIIKITIAFVFITACNPVLFTDSSNVQYRKNTLKRYKKEWKVDRSGCKHMRNDLKLRYLYSGYQLENLHIKNALKVFGKPNKIVRHQYETMYVYYINSQCEHHAPDTSSVKEAVLITRGDTLRLYIPSGY